VSGVTYLLALYCGTWHLGDHHLGAWTFGRWAS